MGQIDTGKPVVISGVGVRAVGLKLLEEKVARAPFGSVLFHMN